MEILTKAAAALWQVLAVGLLLGAGSPALFSLGMRSLDTGRVPAPAGATDGAPGATVASPAGRSVPRSASGSACSPCCSASS